MDSHRRRSSDEASTSIATVPLSISSLFRIFVFIRISGHRIRAHCSFARIGHKNGLSLRSPARRLDPGMRRRLPLRLEIPFQVGGVDDAPVTIHQYADGNPSVVQRIFIGGMVRLPTEEAPTTVILMDYQTYRTFFVEHMAANDGPQIAWKYGPGAQSRALAVAAGPGSWDSCRRCEFAPRQSRWVSLPPLVMCKSRSAKFFPHHQNQRSSPPNRGNICRQRVSPESCSA